MGGCCAKVVQEKPPTSPLTPAPRPQNLSRRQRTFTDPRWDKESFALFVEEAVPFVKVGYLRELAKQGQRSVSRYAAFNESDLHRDLPEGAGIAGVALYAVLSANFGRLRGSGQHGALSPGNAVDDANDEAPTSELRALLAVLDEESNGMPLAADDDLIFWDYACVKPGTEDAARSEMFRMFTHYRVQLILLPDSGLLPGDLSVFGRLDTMAYLALSTFCQRQVNTARVATSAGVDLPSRLIALPSTLLTLHSASHAEVRPTDWSHACKSPSQPPH